MEEEGKRRERGGRVRQGETEEDRKARLALRLGRRALETAIRERSEERRVGKECRSR